MTQTNVNLSVRHTVAIQAAAGRAWGYAREQYDNEFANDDSDADTRRTFWSQVCADYYQRALDLARRRVGNSEDAFEIVQDSAVRLLRFLPDHKRIDNGRN